MRGMDSSGKASCVPSLWTELACLKISLRFFCYLSIQKKNSVMHQLQAASLQRSQPAFTKQQYAEIPKHKNFF